MLAGTFPPAVHQAVLRAEGWHTITGGPQLNSAKPGHILGPGFGTPNLIQLKGDMSTLAAKLAETINTRGKCAIRTMLADLDAEDVKALENVFAEGVGTMQLIPLLHSAGHHVSESTLGRHRRGQCTCG